MAGPQSRLEVAPLREAATSLDEYRQLWDERLDRLDAYLATIQQEEPHDADPDSSASAHADLTPPRTSSP